MPLTVARAHSAVREGIRRCLWWSRFPVATYEEMEIADLRDELDISLGHELPNESARLLTLEVSIRRQFRKKGWLVEVPIASWYRRSAIQGEPVGKIAEFILSKPMEEA